MAYTPLVSIVIPVYNQKIDFFRECIQSALSQSYTNLDIVISDNHSDAGLMDSVQELVSGKVRCVKPVEHLPMHEHFQFAGRQAIGEYIYFLCSDDWLFPDGIKLLVTALQGDDSVCMALGRVQGVAANNLTKIRTYYNAGQRGILTAKESLRYVLEKNIHMTPLAGGLVQTSVFKQINTLFDGTLKYAFDVAYMFKAHEFGNVAYIDEPVGKLRIWSEDEGKLGGNRLSDYIADFIIIKKMISTSPILQACAGDTGSLTKWLRKQSDHWVVILTAGIVRSTISYHEYTSRVTQISTELQDLSVKSRIIYWFLKKPFFYVSRPILLLAYKSLVYLTYKINGLAK